MKAMSDDEKRNNLLHTIVAWREARDQHQPGSPQYKEFQRLMKEAEWELHGLGPSQDQGPPGLVIRIVDPEKPQELSAGQMTEYKGFRIEPIETSPARWRAKISRPDGRKIKVLVTGDEHDSITTGGMEAFSAEAAIDIAKEAIDGGGMT
jgi:hypothetical protein